MRDSLLVTALEVVSHNLAQRNLSLRLFEIGRIYLPVNGEAPREPLTLSLAVGGIEQAHWRAAGGLKERPLDFHDLAAGIHSLSEALHFADLKYQLSKISWAETGTGFSIQSGEKVIGEVGRVRSKIADQFDIKLPIYAAQFDLTGFELLLANRPTFHAMPQFPSAPRDLAMVLDESTTVGEITHVINEIAGTLAEEIVCFDLYRGKPIPAGKKSIAIRITYRKPDASLTSDEVEAIQKQVVENLTRRFQAEIRDH